MNINYNNNDHDYYYCYNSALEFLTKVDLEKNCLKVLPENLGYMTCCTSINVNNNQLTRYVSESLYLLAFQCVCIIFSQ